MADHTLPPPGAPAANSNLQVGTRCEVQNHPGIIRFIGTTAFATGRWVGVELDSPSGKNDGSVHGEVYFTCPPNHGMFVRTTQVRLATAETTPVAATRSTAPPASSARITPAHVGLKSPSPAGLVPPSALTLPRARRGESVSSAGTGGATPRARTGGISASSVRFRSPTTSAAGPPSLSIPGGPAGGTARIVSPSRPPAASIGTRLASPSALRPPASSTNPGSTSSQGRLTTPRRTRGVSTPAHPVDRPTRQMAPPESPRATATQAGAGPKFNKRLSYGGRQLPSPTPALSSMSSIASTPQPPSAENDSAPSTPSRPSSSAGPVPPDSEQSISTEATPHPIPFTPTPAHHSLTDAFTPYGARADPIASQKELDELRAKLRILEAKRKEDRERMSESSRKLAEIEQALQMKDRLMHRLSESSRELKDVRRLLKAAESGREEMETKYHETLEALELLTLDREMAEEKAENFAQEAQILKDKLEEVQTNDDLHGTLDLAAGNTDDLTPAQRTPEYAALERTNERLKEALVRLRDATTETENELQRRVRTLEKDLGQAPEVQAQNAELKAEKARADQHIEDLKTRLDEAMAAEDLVEQLSMRNLDLTEQVEEMKATIEDLESLKELNDEMEENHVETEKQLTAELEFKDSLLRELQAKLEASDETMADYENTIQQFRQLVANLQTDLARLRSREAEQRSEAQELSSQSHAMLSLNLQLQSTVMKAQAKAIDLELRKLEAQQATEHLHFLEPYLPASFFSHENNAIRCLLLFKRLGFKADLLITQLDPHTEKSDAHVNPESLAAAQLRLGLVQLAGAAGAFVAHLAQCPADSFLKLGFLHHDVTTVEKRLDAVVEAVRQEGQPPKSALADVQRSVGELDALVDTHLGGATKDATEPATAAARSVTAARALDLQAEVIFTQLILTRQLVLPAADDDEAPTFDGADQGDLHANFFVPLDSVIQQCKAYKVLSTKLLRRVRETNEDGLAALLRGPANGSSAKPPTAITLLNPAFQDRFAALQDVCGQLARYAQEARTSLAEYVAQQRDDKAALALAEVRSRLLGVDEQYLAHPTASTGAEAVPWTVAAKVFGDLTRDLGATVDLVSGHPAPSGDNGGNSPEATVSYEPREAPWIQRAHQFKAELVLNVEVERKLQALNEEILNLIREIKLKEKALQESGVKIELLEKRMETVKKQAETITQLEEAIQKRGQEKKMYEEAMEGLQTEIDQLEQDNTKLKKAAHKAEKLAAKGKGGELDEIANMTSVEVLELKQRVDALAAAVKYLRGENVHLKRHQLALPTANGLGASAALVLRQLPALSVPSPTTTTSPTATGAGARASPQLHELANETKSLLRDVQAVSASLKIVSLVPRPPTVASGDAPAGTTTTTTTTASAWQPFQRTPQYAFTAQQTLVTTLQHRGQSLQSKIAALRQSSAGLKVPRLSVLAN